MTTNSTASPDVGVTALSISAGALKLHKGVKCVDLLNVDEHSSRTKQSLENAQCAPDRHLPRLTRRQRSETEIDGMTPSHMRSYDVGLVDFQCR